MYNTSLAYRQAIARKLIQSRIVLTITTQNNETLTINDSKIIPNSVSITNKASKNNGFGYGSAYVGEFRASILNADNAIDRYSLYGAKVVPVFYQMLANNTEESIPLGEFYVSEAKRTQKLIALTCYDAMTRFDVPQVVDTFGSPFELLELICNTCGVPLGMTQEEVEAMPNGTEQLTMSSERVSACRDAIAFISTVLCGFATINRTGALEIRQFGTTAVDTIPASRRTSSTIADYETYFLGIKARVLQAGNWIKVTANVTGRESGLILDLGDLPVVQGVNETLQRIAQNIADVLGEVNFTPADVSITGDASIDIGDVVTYTGVNNTSDSVTTIVTSLSWKYHGVTRLTGEGGNARLNAVTDYQTKQVASLETDMSVNEYAMKQFTNASQYGITSQDTIIITFNYSVNKDTTTVFLSTIPIYMSLDGEAIFGYHLNNEEVEEVKVYLERGWHAVTLTNYFANESQSQNRLTVTCRTAYFESDKRIQDAQIAGLIDAVETGEYVIGEIDTTIPAATIPVSSIKAVIFASGINTTESWDGTLLLIEELGAVVLGASGITVKPIEDMPIVATNRNSAAPTFTEQIPAITLGNSNITVAQIVEAVSIGRKILFLTIDTSRANEYTYDRGKVAIIDDEFVLNQTFPFPSTRDTIDSGSMKKCDVDVSEITPTAMSVVTNGEIEHIWDSVTPSWQAVSYGYIALDGGFYGYGSKVNFLNVFEVSSGDNFRIYLGNVTGNRYRVHYYANKSLSDFQTYIDNSTANTRIYQCTTNISGSVDKTDYTEVYTFTPSADGVIIVMTSNNSASVPAYCDEEVNAVYKTLLADDTNVYNLGNEEIESVSAEIEYTQDLNGYDHPWVGGGGNNKLNYDVWKTVGIQRGTAVWENNGVTLTATGNDCYTNYGNMPELARIPVKEGDVVKLSWEESTNKSGDCYIFSGTGAPHVHSNNASSKSCQLTVGSGVTFVTFRMGVANAGDTISYKNIMLQINSSATAYEPYENICPIGGHTSETIIVEGGNLLPYDEMTDVSFYNATDDMKDMFNSLDAGYYELNMKAVITSVTGEGDWICGIVAFNSAPTNISAIEQLSYTPYVGQEVDLSRTLYISPEHVGKFSRIEVYGCAFGSINPKGTADISPFTLVKKDSYTTQFQTSVVWNQMLKNPHLVNGNYWSVNTAYGTASVADNKLTYTITTKNANQSFTQPSISFTQNHIYLLSCWLTVPQDQVVGVYTGNSVTNIANVKANVRTRIFNIFKSNVTSTRTCYIYPARNSGLNVGAVVTLEDANLFDLTEMFGEGKEMLGRFSFLYNFPNNYYDYDVSGDSVPFTIPIYGGSINVSTGVLSIDRYNVDLGYLYWQYSSTQVSDKYRKACTEVLFEPLPSSSSYPDLKSSGYKPETGNNVYATKQGISIHTTGGVMIFDERYPLQNDLPDFANAVRGVTVCYKMVSPVTYQLTPQEVRTLLGENHVNTSTAKELSVTLTSGRVLTGESVEFDSRATVVMQVGLLTNLDAEMFEDYGFDDLADMQDALTSIFSLEEFSILRWCNAVETASTMLATVTGTPSAQDILTPVFTITALHVTGIEQTETDTDGSPRVSVKFDSGAWEYYDFTDEQWEEVGTGTIGYMTVADLENLTEQIWSEKFENASTMQTKLTLPTANDTIALVRYKFLQEEE